MHEDPSLYMRLVGRFIYLTITHPYLSYAVHILSQFMQASCKAHYDAAIWALRYIKSHPRQGLFLRAVGLIVIYNSMLIVIRIGQVIFFLDVRLVATLSCMAVLISPGKPKSNLRSPGLLSRPNIEPWRTLVRRLNGCGI